DEAAGVVGASRSGIPSSNSDLHEIARNARAITALSQACSAARCPTVETCEAAARLLQALTDAQAYLDATDAALNRAAASAAAAHNNVVAQTRITSTNIGIAMHALGVQEYLARIATLLMDLASLADDIKGMAEKGSLL